MRQSYYDDFIEEFERIVGKTLVDYMQLHGISGVLNAFEEYLIQKGINF